jgi:hypothetical protein
MSKFVSFTFMPLESSGETYYLEVMQVAFNWIPTEQRASLPVEVLTTLYQLDVYVAKTRGVVTVL